MICKINWGEPILYFKDETLLISEMPANQCYANLYICIKKINS